VRDGDRTVPYAELPGASGAARTAVLGYGSNPAPETLARKLRDAPAADVAVPVLRLAVDGLDAVWSAHVHAGYVPATIAASPGTTLQAWALLLTADERRVVDASESLGRNYALGRLDGVRARFADGTPCGDLLSYVSLHGALLLDGAPVAVAPVPADGRTLPALDEPAVLRRVHGIAGGGDEGGFLRALASDPAAADRCTAALRGAARPFAWSAWTPLVPPG
jgi:hypothetical protein